MPDLNMRAATIEFDNGAIGMLENFISGRRVFRVEMHSQRACAEGDLEERRTFMSGRRG